MPGSAAAIGVVAAVSVLTVGLCAVAGAAVHGQRLASAADAAALAAADAATGAVPGIPCERAAEVAATSGAELTACALESLVATVTVSAPFAGFAASVSSRAGPPPAPER
jgi:secretion/DNA translocation related TadE-like protein